MKERTIREELKECRELLADLFQGGLALAPQSMPQRLEKEAGIFRQYGMDTLAQMLEELAGRIDMRRHDPAAQKEEELCDLFCRIEWYLEEGIDLAGLDEAGRAVILNNGNHFRY